MAIQSGSNNHNPQGHNQYTDNNSGSGTKGSGEGQRQQEQGGSGSKQQGGGTRGGTPEQHAEAGRQSHKNDQRS